MICTVVPRLALRCPALSRRICTPENLTAGAKFTIKRVSRKQIKSLNHTFVLENQKIYVTYSV